MQIFLSHWCSNLILDDAKAIEEFEGGEQEAEEDKKEEQEKN